MAQHLGMNNGTRSLTRRIGTIPRCKILDGPTPLVRLARLSKILEIDLWMKRDDLAGPSLGGNKSRQLEYYFGAALAEEADTILITGAVQSNFVRLAAAVAARLGMRSIVQLEERVTKPDHLYRHSGNVLLSRLLGAEIMFYPDGEDEEGADASLYARAETLRAEGRRPFVIPLGMKKPPIGSLGYVRCAQEITAQAETPFDYIVVPSGSGATHLGLVAGMKIHCPSVRVIGSCVRRDRQKQADRLAVLGSGFDQLTGGTDFVGATDFEIWDGALEPGYGQLGPIAADAMALMAHHEGQILDPVYSAKAFAVVPEFVRTRKILSGSRVLFVHTGGLAALFAYQNDLMQRL